MPEKVGVGIRMSTTPVPSFPVSDPETCKTSVQDSAFDSNPEQMIEVK
jgi:hypothetical protein